MNLKVYFYVRDFEFATFIFMFRKKTMNPKNNIFFMWAKYIDVVIIALQRKHMKNTPNLYSCSTAN